VHQTTIINAPVIF